MRTSLNLRVLLGVLLIAARIAVLLIGKVRIPFGRLPGDFAYRGKNFSFYFPVSTSLLLSILLSVLFYLIARFRR
jgi:hypothetical protein